MRLRDQRGGTLIELLVGVTVFAVMILVIDAVFFNALRGARRAELSAGVSQNARVAVERLLAEIRESRIAEIQVDAGSTGVIFRSARPSDSGSVFCMDWRTSTEPLALANPGCAGVPLAGTYAPVWQRWIGYFFDAGSGQVRRITSSSALAFPLSGGQVIATSVEGFSVSVSGERVSVNLKGSAQEIAQGARVPPQQILLNVSTAVHN